MKLPPKTIGAGAPEIADGLTLARFDDLQLVKHPDWAGVNTYGKDDDGQRYHFQFTLLDTDGAVLYDDGDPIELDKLTTLATGEKSGFRKTLMGLMTPAEIALYDAATEDAPFEGEFLKGRVVFVKIVHSEKSGWPQIDIVAGIAPKPKGAK